MLTGALLNKCSEKFCQTQDLQHLQKKESIAGVSLQIWQNNFLQIVSLRANASESSASVSNTDFEYALNYHLASKYKLELPWNNLDICNLTWETSSSIQIQFKSKIRLFKKKPKKTKKTIHQNKYSNINILYKANVTVWSLILSAPTL